MNAKTRAIGRVVFLASSCFCMAMVAGIQGVAGFTSKTITITGSETKSIIFHIDAGQPFHFTVSADYNITMKFYVTNASGAYNLQSAWFGTETSDLVESLPYRYSVNVTFAELVPSVPSTQITYTYTYITNLGSTLSYVVAAAGLVLGVLMIFLLVRKHSQSLAQASSTGESSEQPEAEA